MRSAQYGGRFIQAQTKAIIMLRSTLIICLSLSALGHGQEKQEEETISPAAARAMIQEWVQTERMISEEKEGWEIEREQLNDLINLYETELGLLKAEVEKAGESHVELDKEKATLESEVKQMRAERRKLANKVVELSARMVKISNNFPQPLKDLVSADIDTLSLVQGETEMRDGVVALSNVLKQAGRFNRAVTYSEEMQQVEGDGQRQLQVIYMGLGRAYFLSGKKAGIGTPSADGWKWSEREDISKQVTNVIRIFKKTAQPGLVKLPVEVKP